MAFVIRVVVQHSPTLFSISLADERALTSTFEYQDQTFYRAETHDHWVLYKAALSGWGGVHNDQGGHMVPDSRQR